MQQRGNGEGTPERVPDLHEQPEQELLGAVTGPCILGDSLHAFKKQLNRAFDNFSDPLNLLSRDAFRRVKVTEHTLHALGLNRVRVVL